MFIGYEQVPSTGTAKSFAGGHITPPGKATGALLQADSQNIRYTCDGTEPTTTRGMLLLTTSPPEEFLMEDVKRLKFIQSAGGAGNLNIHYFAGRDV